MMECERHSIQYGKREISFSLKYSKRKSVGISVSPEMNVEVVAPIGTPFACIQRVINRKSRWIIKQIEELERYRPNIKRSKNYTSGQTIKLLGRDYMIKVLQIKVFEEEEIVKDHRSINVYTRDREETERINLRIQDWFRNEAMIYIGQKFETCYDKIKKYDIPKPHYYLRSMEQRWGSCTSTGTIFLNPDIIQLPSHCIEYVIMHEMCHLKHKDHSKDYYYFLDTLMPDWLIRKKTLDSFFEL